jgi:hypothetical protein
MKKSLLLGLMFIIMSEHDVRGLNVYVDESIESIARGIVDNLVNEDFAEVRTNFHSSLRDQLSADQIQAAWNGTKSTLGSFEEIISVKETTVQGFKQILVRCKFKNDNATVQVTFNEDEKVIGLYILP